MNVGDKIETESSSWNFAGDVPENFIEHARKSIPLYREGHKLISDYSDFFVKDNSVCYEIGVSTGELISQLAKKNKNKKNITWIGIDSEEKMTEFASKYTENISNINIINQDCVNFDYEPSDIIISYYCIQFIYPKYRQLLFNRIYKSLNWGGAFFLFEKVRGPDARFQDIATCWYNEWKESNGFSPSQILNKTKSLKGILEPFSTQGNLDLLRQAGFKDISTIMKFSCFEGFLAIK
ncbi:methyltransferase domain-containing protein [Prochlorococcus marinus]|uniref:Methyltransferase n=1 Tax=Prochlorococcus marinus XMU1408 TaxID=2213228 RepID=A0A318R104_PROMR|nr:methyltransferase domain-containing protein [Prochlorococcus marinus]MBW3041827.1 methyltransferase [Prochlorococcus marinus str. XMU1408]PYE02966.1 methyltransferase [Prochlorococcus marinus XMU1408]